MRPAEIHTHLIKEEARRLGFMSVGIAEAVYLDEDARRLEAWLSRGYQGKMAYMENHFDLRVDPRKLVPGARSVITLLLNYYPRTPLPEAEVKTSKYALGEDYHHVIREKLHALLAFIRDKIGAVEGRGFVDSAPVLERSWAVRSGLGWVGKNGNLLQRQAGSFFFIATLITDLELDYDPPTNSSHCGDCTRCLDACPTGAIVAPAEIDGSRCISYLTIELKDAFLPLERESQLEGWVFGCDICQDVCPWNRFSTPHQEPRFDPLPPFQNPDREAWLEITPEEFREIFRKSPLKRTRWKGWQRNLRATESGTAPASSQKASY